MTYFCHFCVINKKNSVQTASRKIHAFKSNVNAAVREKMSIRSFVRSHSFYYTRKTSASEVGERRGAWFTTDRHITMKAQSTWIIKSFRLRQQPAAAAGRFGRLAAPFIISDGFSRPPAPNHHIFCWPLVGKRSGRQWKTFHMRWHTVIYNLFWQLQIKASIKWERSYVWFTFWCDFRWKFRLRSDNFNFKPGRAARNTLLRVV